MNKIQADKILKLREEGYGYKRIAIELSMSVNTVKSYCKRNPIRAVPVNSCRSCGIILNDVRKRRTMQFCSNKCRMAWWNKNAEGNGRASYVCNVCGRVFLAYKSRTRKYCSRVCYGISKRKGGIND